MFARKLRCATENGLSNHMPITSITCASNVWAYHHLVQNCAVLQKEEDRPSCGGLTNQLLCTSVCFKIAMCNRMPITSITCRGFTIRLCYTTALCNKRRRIGRHVAA